MVGSISWSHGSSSKAKSGKSSIPLTMEGVASGEWTRVEALGSLLHQCGSPVCLHYASQVPSAGYMPSPVMPS